MPHVSDLPQRFIPDREPKQATPSANRARLPLARDGRPSNPMIVGHPHEKYRVASSTSFIVRMVKCVLHACPALHASAAVNRDTAGQKSPWRTHSRSAAHEIVDSAVPRLIRRRRTGIHLEATRHLKTPKLPCAVHLPISIGVKGSPEHLAGSPSGQICA